ncbi:MAG TPA: hypothetical protein VGR23_05865 [Candidatus Dormibacteraeota bacterium]|nr:hypothetical protein [Candidatus Dormibacteraeota bacterium]
MGKTLALAATLALASGLWTAPPAAAQPLPGTTCALFPASNILNTDISSLSVHSQSATWKSNMALNTNLHPDLGTVAQQYGMPVNVAPPPTTGLTPTFSYDSESDHPAEGYPIDQSTLIEGGPSAPSWSDRHALVVNKNNCKLYELYNLQSFTNGQTPQAGSGAVWDLGSNAMRPLGWTSADAAGLPITPLLLRPDEILAGSIPHAIRFTTHCTHGYIWPASHDAGLCGTGYPPMGARFRLRSSFSISGFSANTQAVLRAFQHYGIVLADNGADWYVQGTTDDWWGTTAGAQVVNELKSIPASPFDAVEESSIQAAGGSYQATPFGSCTAVSLGASPLAAPVGATVTWTAAATGCPNARYRFWELDPGRRWSMVQDYSANSSYTWHSPRSSGTYFFEVDARDASESTAYDVVANRLYYLTGCTNASLTPYPLSPGATGIAVSLGASSMACAHPLYRFWVKDPGRRWSMVQDYSPSSLYVWTQTGAVGTYSLEVDVRDAAETTAYDVVANATFTTAPCTAAGLSANPPGPEARGTQITLSAGAVCPGVATYRFWVRAPGGAWQIARDYSTTSSLTWFPTVAGTYGLEVDVRNQNATSSYEAVSNLTFVAT